MAQQDQEGVLLWDTYEVGIVVHADKYVFKSPGRLILGFGHEAPHHYNLLGDATNWSQLGWKSSIF